MMEKMDAAEFMRVFEATKDGLYRLFLKQAKEGSLAEDLVQECYLRLWEKREGPEDPESFVFGIAYNMVKEFHRKRIRAAIDRMETLPETESLSVTDLRPEMQDTYSPDKQYQEKETRQTVREVLGRLSPEKRAAFALIREEERSYKEAAKLLGVPVSTLEKQVAGSIRILRKALAVWVIFLYK